MRFITNNQRMPAISKTFCITAFALVMLACQVLYYYSVTRMTKIVAIFFVGVLFICAAYAALKFFIKREEYEDVITKRVFPCALVIFASLSVFFFPAGSIPDEPYHFYNSYAYCKSVISPGYDSIRAEDAPLFESGGMLSCEIKQSDWAYVQEHIFDCAESGEIPIDSLKGFDASKLPSFDLIADINTVLPQQKIPSALGIGVGLILGLNHVWIFYLGRIFNMLFAALLIIAAVRIVPICRNAMMVAALFPMTLHLLGSYSYDAPIIGFGFLLTALVAKMFYGDGKITVNLIIAVLVTTFLIAPCKVVYTLIGFSALFGPSRRFGSKRQCATFKAILVIVSIIAILIPKLTFLVALGVSTPGQNARGSEVGTFWSLSDILSDPFGSWLLVWRTLECNGAFWLMNIPGDSLGWFQQNTSLPDFVSIFLLLIFGVACIQSTDDSCIAPVQLRVVMFVAVFIAAAGVILSMWLGWTFLEDIAIQGVQGRYFLPLIPMLAISFRSSLLTCRANLGYAVVISSTTMVAMSMMYIMAVAA